ncbi:MAG: ice-binding family protein [Chloroflexi bacterium]|nr:ice-binding family protein [Chloroflexota bacterium]
MKKVIKDIYMKRFLIIATAFLVVAVAAIGTSQAAPILGSAADYAVLGGTTVTNSGTSVINGDLGVWSGSSITGFPPGIVNGTIHTNDMDAHLAQNDVTAAYISLAGMGVTQDLTGQNLGGKTLTPGVYHFSSSAQLTGQLTLNVQNNPNALFVFQIESTLTTDSNSSVIMINAPENFCNKYWQVGSSATLGTNTAFIGNILALTSITLNGGTLDGRALARNGAVEITAMETITPPCIPEPATITLLCTGALALLKRKSSK